MLIKTNVPGFYKDTESGAIINKNIDEYKAVKAKQKKSKEQDAVARKVERMEIELSEIKDLLLQLVNKT